MIFIKKGFDKIKDSVFASAIIGAVAIGSLFAGPLNAQQSFDFSFSVGPDQGTGQLTATSKGDGSYLATSGSINVTASSDPADIGIFSLIPGGPSSTLSPLGAFMYDNLVFPSSSPTLDTSGLLFGTSSLEINLWGNSSGSYNGVTGNYSFYSANSSGYNVQDTANGSVTFTPVPEPSTYLLMGSFVGIAVLLKRRHATAVAARL